MKSNIKNLLLLLTITLVGFTVPAKEKPIFITETTYDTGNIIGNCAEDKVDALFDATQQFINHQIIVSRTGVDWNSACTQAVRKYNISTNYENMYVKKVAVDVQFLGHEISTQFPDGSRCKTGNYIGYNIYRCTVKIN